MLILFYWSLSSVVQKKGGIDGAAARAVLSAYGNLGLELKLLQNVHYTSSLFLPSHQTGQHPARKVGRFFASLGDFCA